MNTDINLFAFASKFNFDRKEIYSFAKDTGMTYLSTVDTVEGAALADIIATMELKQLVKQGKRVVLCSLVNFNDNNTEYSKTLGFNGKFVVYVESGSYVGNHKETKLTDVEVAELLDNTVRSEAREEYKALVMASFLAHTRNSDY